MNEAIFERLRYFLKDSIRQEVDFSATEQARGVAPPPIEKPWPTGADLIDLPKPGQWSGIGPVTVEA